MKTLHPVYHHCHDNELTHQDILNSDHDYHRVLVEITSPVIPLYMAIAQLSSVGSKVLLWPNNT
jgi:hypothetical protein